MLPLPGALTRCSAGAFLVVALIGAGSSSAHAEPIGPELPLPPVSTGGGLAYGSDLGQAGWLTAGSGVLDPTVGDEIHASRLAPEGGLLAGPAQVSDDPDDPAGFPHDNPQAPDIAYNARRREFLVVWAQGFRIWARRVALDGKPLDLPFAISSEGRDHYAPDVAHNPVEDEYMVVWADSSEGSADAEMQVRAQRLDGAGEEIGPDDTRISDNATFDEPGAAGFGVGLPQIAANPASGGYLVVWAPTYFRDRDEQIVAQRLDADGAETGADDFHPVGAPAAAAGRNAEPAVASNGTDYLLVWTDLSEIRAQRLSASGAEIGPDDVAISDTVPAADPFLTTSAPAVAHNAVSGQWLIGWEGADLLAGGLTEGIFGQHLAPNGSEIGTDDFLVSGGHRGLAALASSLDRDEFLFTWRLEGVASARRVQATNCSLTSTCPPPVAPGGTGGPSTPALPTLSAIAAGLSRSARSAARSLRRLGLEGLLRRRRFAIENFQALTAGRLGVTLTARSGAAAGPAARVTIARGGRTISSTGRYRLIVRLTRRGRIALAGRPRARLRLEIRFRDRAKRLATARRALVIAR